MDSYSIFRPADYGVFYLSGLLNRFKPVRLSTVKVNFKLERVNASFLGNQITLKFVKTKLLNLNLSMIVDPRLRPQHRRFSYSPSADPVSLDIHRRKQDARW